MADGITFRMVTEPFMRMIADKQRRMPAAARWAVREAGRQAQKAARAKAPVLSGRLRASITPSRNIRPSVDRFSIKVGPRGDLVHLYAAKIENRAHYMAAGERAAHAEMERIAVEAFGRVWRN